MELPPDNDVDNGDFYEIVSNEDMTSVKSDDSYVMVEYKESSDETSGSEKEAFEENKSLKDDTEFEDCEDMDETMDETSEESFGEDASEDSEDMDETMDETSEESFGEDASEDSELDYTQTFSSPTKRDRIYYKFGTVQEYKRDNDTLMIVEFPTNIKLKEHMEIKDVVKDHLLHFLPVKSLLKFRTVSKEWDKWIINPFFAHKQSLFFGSLSGFFCESLLNSRTFISLNSSAYGVPSSSLGFLPQSVAIKSSCNGLILCQGNDNDDAYYICNPANKEWEQLPKSDKFYLKEPVLAFEPSELNFEPFYQVICPVSVDFEMVTHFDIYSSDTKLWKLVEANCSELASYEMNEHGFYLNGVAYWVTGNDELLAFDVKNEFCGVTTLPSGAGISKGGLCFMEGELCFIKANIQGKDFVLDVFGGMDMSLMDTIRAEFPHEVTEDDNGYCRVLSGLDEDFVVVTVAGCVYTFNLNDSKFEKTGRARWENSTTYFPYVNSFVSLGGQ